MNSRPEIVRRDIAACFRLAAMFGMDDIVWNHISARASQDTMVTLPFGYRFDEASVSKIIEVDFDGFARSDVGLPSKSLLTSHIPLYKNNEGLNCIVHCHTIAGMAVSALDEGFVPLVQDAFLFDCAVHTVDYGGLLESGCESVLGKLPSGTKAIVLRNHGMMTIGRSVAEAFVRMYFLERACQVQIAVLSTGRPIRQVAKLVVDATRHSIENFDPEVDEWPALLRMLEKEDPSYLT